MDSVTDTRLFTPDLTPQCHKQRFRYLHLVLGSNRRPLTSSLHGHHRLLNELPQKSPVHLPESPLIPCETCSPNDEVNNLTTPGGLDLLTHHGQPHDVQGMFEPNPTLNIAPIVLSTLPRRCIQVLHSELRRRYPPHADTTLASRELCTLILNILLTANPPTVSDFTHLLRNCSLSDA